MSLSLNYHFDTKPTHLHTTFLLSVRLERTFFMRFCILLKNCGSRALFMGLASTFFSRNNFKTGFHSTIHTFKNYFVTVFSAFSNKRYPNISSLA